MYLTVKRIFDIFCSVLALLVLSPLLISVIIVLKLTGDGEVWYSQKRVGFKNKCFKVFKFTTMLKNSDQTHGCFITTKNDSRITPIGGFLRKSKIDELPQLINILLGDMSIVGPRPVMPQSFEAYPVEMQKIIYSVKPGLTGIGSIIFRDEGELLTKVKNQGGDMMDFYKNKIYPFKGSLEQWYHKNISFLTDVKLIILTAWGLLFPKNQAIYKWFKDLPQRPF